MISLFWRSRLKQAANGVARSMPATPADIDDNIYLMQAAQAAQADKDSKAYDEFLFSEDGFETMPFEVASDDFIELQVKTNSERATRKTLPIDLRLSYLERIIESAKRKSADVQHDISEVEAKLDREKLVLAGQITGEAGGFWPGTEPDTTSRARHMSRFIFKLAAFVAVAAIDFAVIFLSLRLVTPSQDEALTLAFPTAAIQVIFPHLIGHSLKHWTSGAHNKRKYLVQAIFTSVAWVTYLIAMTEIRYNFIAEEYKKKTFSNPETFLGTVLWIFSFLILLGLGAWLMMNTMNSNPAENAYSRLKFVHFRLLKKKRKAERIVERAEADLEREVKLSESIRAEWQARGERYAELSVAAKAAYRRALVNQVGDVDFTNSYLSKTPFKFAAKRKRTHD